MEDDERARLEKLGEKRVRQLLVNGMLVSQPAYDWLDELEKERETKQEDGDHAA
jgi:hypothetical protein